MTHVWCGLYVNWIWSNLLEANSRYHEMFYMDQMGPHQAHFGQKYESSRSRGFKWFKWKETGLPLIISHLYSINLLDASLRYQWNPKNLRYLRFKWQMFASTQHIYESLTCQHRWYSNPFVRYFLCSRVFPQAVVSSTTLLS